MKNRSLGAIAICLLVIWQCAVSISATPPAGYHVTGKWELGGEGGWDYLYADAGSRQLFISRGTHVMVVNLDTGKVVGDIPDTKGVHGVAIATELGKGFTSNGADASVTIFDLKTLKVLGTAKTSPGADCIIYDPASKRVFTFNAGSRDPKATGGKDATAIDAVTGEVAGTIPLGDKPEFATADGRGHVFVNLEGKSQVVEIDSRKLTVTNTWPLAPGESPSGMAIDAKNHRIFSGCHNKLMTVMDTDNGKVVASVPIGEGVDANAFDPATKLAFSSNGAGDGSLTVVHQDSPDKYTVVENVKTERGARTMALDPKTHNIYLAFARYEPAPAATTENPRPRPKMIPNSFSILVVSP